MTEGSTLSSGIRRGKAPFRQEPRSFSVSEAYRSPDQQMAHAFLWRADELLNDDGELGLVLPAKSFLHNRTRPAVAARQRVFTELEVDTVVDLSPVRRDLFALCNQSGLCPDRAVGSQCSNAPPCSRLASTHPPVRID